MMCDITQNVRRSTPLHPQVPGEMASYEAEQAALLEQYMQELDKIDDPDIFSIKRLEVKFRRLGLRRFRD